MQSEIGYKAAGYAMFVCLLASLLWPPVTKTSGRIYYVGWFALAASTLFGVYNYLMPKKYDMRTDLVVLIPALLVMWVKCLLGIVLTRSNHKPPHQS